ncbi:MAG TPA: hypothetical protein VI386_35880, partial [Candidatus Sulfotelmatobacter sp.]
MAHRPNLSPGPRNLIHPTAEDRRLSPEKSSAEEKAEEKSDSQGSRGPEADIAELFLKFEENSGGTLTPQFAADLALDIVLNEFVEQACLATGADAAAVVLRRGSDFVCRATTGAGAPALGARMDPNSGLSGLCIRSGQAQRCDDAHSDFRVDAEA